MIKKNLKKLIIIYLILTILTLSTAIASTSNIKILNKNFQISAIDDKGAQTGVYYDVMITLINEGSEQSENITLTLYDEFDLPLSKNYTFNPSETKTFVFKDYPIIGTGSQEIRIELFPTNESLRTPSNTISDTMNLTYSSPDDTSTPSIQFIGILTILACICYIYKKK